MTHGSLRPLALPILALAPFLVAARGCAFGSDSVSLGENEGGDGGSDGPGVGGASTAGAAGTGGVAGKGSGAGGGSPQGGSAGTTGVGGGGAGASGDQPCLETLTPLEELPGFPPGYSFEDFHELTGHLLVGNRRAPLSHVGGSPTELTLALAGTRFYYVESRRNPDFTLDIFVNCENHVRAIAYGRLVSEDGAFDESIPELTLDIGRDTGGLSALAVFSIPREELGGSYRPPLPDNQCFVNVQFNLAVLGNGFAGDLLNTVGLYECGSTDPNRAITAQTAGSFACEGQSECVTVPPDSMVIEADGCRRFGQQIARPGDESTFTLAGDTLTRDEVWGCGCPERSKFIMTYRPSSPIELQLCLDESADPCEAGCSGPVSHDLSRAIAAAGTREFVFVDSD